MSDDELRAFLESATIGGDDSDTETTASEAPRSASATRDPLNLPPTEPIIGLPGLANAAPAAPPAPSARPVNDAPSFDDIMNPRAGDPELPPIVLPGPPAQPPVFRIDTSTPASNAQAAPTTPIGQTPPTAPLPAPTSARSAAAAQPLSASQLAAELGFDAPSGNGGDYERISVTGGENEHRRVLPWIVVAAVAAVALIASVFVVLAVRGSGEPTTPPVTNPTTPTQQTPTTPDPTSTEDPPTEPTTPEPADGVPSVEVGRTFSMDITQWNTTVDVSSKLGGGLHYVLDGDNLVLKGGDLLPKFPDSCADMRAGFGMTRAADGSFAVLRPEQRCSAAPELYDAVWGLVAAMTESAKKS